MGILNTVTYAVQTEDAMQFASFLETLRLEDVYQECTGLPDGSEVKMDRCFAYPYSEYGDVKEACLAIKDNDMSLMLLYANYRVEYELSAQKQWNSVVVKAYSGVFKKYNYDYFNRLKKEHMAGLTDFFKGRLIAGQDNLYGMLGSGASDPNFLKQYMYKLVSGKG